MSTFRSRLQRICEGVDGVLVATLMGIDGLPVEQVSTMPTANGTGDIHVELDALLVEYSGLIGQAQLSAEIFAAGGLEELSISSERLTTLIRVLTPEYFVAVALRPEANRGRARYLLRVHADALVDELS